MQFKTLDNKVVHMRPKSGSSANTSKLQLAAVEVVLATLGDVVVMQEVRLPVYSYKKYPFDIFIPLYKLIIEVHGAQHYSFNTFFHRNIMEYNDMRFRDDCKKLFCEDNGLYYLEFKYHESEEEWKNKIESLGSQ